MLVDRGVSGQRSGRAAGNIRTPIANEIWPADSRVGQTPLTRKPALPSLYLVFSAPFLLLTATMTKRGTKATRKFASSGQLQKTIQARRKHQQIQKKIQKKTSGKKSGKGKERAPGPQDAAGSEDDEGEGKQEKGSKKCVRFSLARG